MAEFPPVANTSGFLRIGLAEAPRVYVADPYTYDQHSSMCGEWLVYGTGGTSGGGAADDPAPWMESQAFAALLLGRASNASSRSVARSCMPGTT